jgi:hypothetical protein
MAGEKMPIAWEAYCGPGRVVLGKVVAVGLQDQNLVGLSSFAEAEMAREKEGFRGV